MDDIKKKLGKETFKQAYTKNSAYKEPKEIADILNRNDIDFTIIAIDDGMTENGYEFSTLRIYGKPKKDGE